MIAMVFICLCWKQNYGFKKTEFYIILTFQPLICPPMLSLYNSHIEMCVQDTDHSHFSSVWPDRYPYRSIILNRKSQNLIAIYIIEWYIWLTIWVHKHYNKHLISVNKLTITQSEHECNFKLKLQMIEILTT